MSDTSNFAGRRIRYVSLDAGATYLGVSVTTLRRAIRRGDLKAHRLGRQIIRVDLHDLEGLLREVPAARFDP